MNFPRGHHDPPIAITTEQHRATAPKARTVAGIYIFKTSHGPEQSGCFLMNRWFSSLCGVELVGKLCNGNRIWLAQRQHEIPRGPIWAHNGLVAIGVTLQVHFHWQWHTLQVATPNVVDW